MYNVMIKERVRDLWINKDGSLNNKNIERIFVANARPLTEEEAEEVRQVCEACVLTDKDIQRYTNATIYPKGWLAVWVEPRNKKGGNACD